MKLAQAMVFLKKILLRDRLQQGPLFEMVNHVRVNEIYAEMARRGLLWTGARWIRIRRVKG